MNSKIWNKYFICIFIAAIMLQVGNQIIMTVLPLYIDSLGLPPSVLGLGHALSALAAMAGAPLMGAWADRKSKPVVFMTGCILMGFGMIGFVALPFVLPIVIIRIIQGFGVSVGSVGTAIATDALPPAKVKNGLSYYSIAGTIAGAVGADVGLRLILGGNYAPSWFGGAAIFALGAILVLTLHGKVGVPVSAVRVESHSAGERKGLWQILERAAFVPGIIQLFLMAASSAYAYLPTYGAEAGIQNISLYFSIQAVASLGANLFLGKFIDKIKDQRILFGIGISMTATAFLCLFFMQGELLFFAAARLNGFGNGVSMNAVTTLSMSKAPVERRGAAAATFNSMGSLGYSIGSFLWGLAIDSMGYRTIYGAAFALPLAALLLSLIVFRPTRLNKEAAR